MIELDGEYATLIQNLPRDTEQEKTKNTTEAK